MTGRSAAGLAIRAGTIVALIGLALAIALIAWQERLASTAASSGSDAAGVVASAGHLRIAILILAVSAASLVMVAILLARSPSTNAQEAAATDQAAPGAQSASLGVDTSPALSVPLARMGHLMSVSTLIRGFCHELNNELGPVQGYAELLCGDTRLSELHRRQAIRIRDAARSALIDIHSFGAALGWSSDPTHVTRLGEMAAEAARSARAAMPARIELEVAPGAEVEVTATESEVGQAILHLCAAASPLLGRQDAPIRIMVDTIVGASSATADESPIGRHRLEIWSDPVDPERSKVQFGTLRATWRYGRVRLGFDGHGWSRDVVAKLFDLSRPDEATADIAAVALVGSVMVETGGVIMIDTCPGKHTMTTLLWPTRIAPEVGAPLELDAREDELDALVIHGSEEAAEELSRRLSGYGLRVASTTSADMALDLIAEMGARCHAVVLAQTNGGEVATRIRQAMSRPRIFQFATVPEAMELERLAAELRRTESAK